jgi:hypothetical protein
MVWAVAALMYPSAVTRRVVAEKRIVTVWTGVWCESVKWLSTRKVSIRDARTMSNKQRSAFVLRGESEYIKDFIVLTGFLDSLLLIGCLCYT